MIQDLSVVGPFAAVGLIMIGVCLMYAQQTTLSGRALDKLLAGKSAVPNRPETGKTPSVPATVMADVSAPPERAKVFEHARSS